MVGNDVMRLNYKFVEYHIIHMLSYIRTARGHCFSIVTHFFYIPLSLSLSLTVFILIYVLIHVRGVQRHPPATQNASPKSSEGKNKEVRGQGLAFVSREHKRIKLQKFSRE